MRAYSAYILTNLRLTARDRLVVFFNFLFPLVFFFAFGEGFGARTSSGALAQVVAMVLMIGILGSGFFGAGMRATTDRETGILRRFKVAPITPAPILAAGVITGWVLFMPTVVFFLAIAKLRYGMPLPDHPLSLFLMISLGVLAFRSLGLIVAAVVNSMAESQILIQLLYLPMLMLSGATVPLNIMPDWLQIVAGFLPSSHLYLGMQAILVRNQSLWQNRNEAGALLLTSVIALFIASRLFRWEKDDKLKPSAKFWVLAVLAPFILMGALQSYSKDNLRKTRILSREMRRHQNWLIRDARIFLGDGAVLESGGILIRNGKIVQVFEGKSPDAKSLNAEPLDASGKTVLPGLIDAGVQLALNGAGGPATDKDMERALAAYLYCGVTAVRSAPDPTGIAQRVQQRVASGELSGAALYLQPGLSPAQPLIAAEMAAGYTLILKDSLLQQVVRPSQLEILRRMASVRTPAPDFQLPSPPQPLVPATLSGSLMLPHGAALHRELQLWVRQGISPKDALVAATSSAARVLGAGSSVGLIRAGYDATLFVVEGNPLEDIAATQRIWYVLFKGEHVRRDELFDGLDQH